MGVGHDLGLQLRSWLEHEPTAMRQPRAVANRLVDALGANDQLKGAVRDLASQPLLQQALHSRGITQQSAIASLSNQLSHTYAPAVLQELLDLISAATGVRVQAETAPPSAEPPAATPSPATNRQQSQQRPTQPRTPATLQALKPTLKGIAPGLALSASGALVFSWCGGELDRSLFEAWGWSGGVVLALALGVLQALALGPCPDLPQRWCLLSEQADRPQQAWRWLSHNWIHSHRGEAGLNLLLLLVLLGASPLQLQDVVLRYCLTSLACLAPAVLCASHWGVQRRWSGASGAISAIIGLACGMSLLQWRELSFDCLGLVIPAWVLLLVYGTLQLAWQLPRSQAGDTSRPYQRLLSNSWIWGLQLGLLWALISRVQQLLA